MTRLLFASHSPWVWVAIAAASAAAFWLYRRELRRRGADGPLGYLAAVLRAAAVALILAMLLEPTLEVRNVVGRPSPLVIAVDDSRSMRRSDGDAQSRWSQAAAILQPGGPLDLRPLADRYRVQLLQTAGRGERELWGGEPGEAPAELSVAEPSPFAGETALGELLERHRDAAIVVLSDGAVNAGPPLAEAALARGPDAPPLFFVGLGEPAGSADPRVVSVSTAEQADRNDRLSGTVRIDGTSGSPAQLFVMQAGRPVWSAEVPAGQGVGDVAFDFPLRQIVDAAAAEAGADGGNATVRSLPVDFTAELRQRGSDAEPENNSLPFRVWVSLVRSRCLLVEGRPRWETRYVRNALDRDPAWDVEPLLLGADPVAGSDRSNAEPAADATRLLEVFSSPESLAPYDLVVFGECPPEAFPPAAQEVLERYVAESGGGLVFIDGPFGFLRSDRWEALRGLLPIDPDPLAAEAYDLSAAYRVAWTRGGRQLSIYRGVAESAAADSAWSDLPPLYVAAGVQPAAAASVLAYAESDASPVQVPLFVEQRVGAGRVFYSATDQTWKWRYARGDAVHRRFWTQVARQYARQPYLIEAEGLAIDVPPRTLRSDESVPVRARLTGDRFTDDPQRLVYAVVEPTDAAGVRSQAAEVGSPPAAASPPAARHQLNPDSSLPGQYTAMLPPLPPGRYTVRFESGGMSAGDRELAADVLVADNNRGELLVGGSDFEAMQRAADSSGGGFYRLSELDALRERLDQLATARVDRNSLPLWQSFLLFLPLIAVLSAEWLIRKRCGLI